MATANIIENPYQLYTDLNGDPLDNGYVYIGLANQDPTTNPVDVFWDAAGTIPASQPLRTLNGYIVNSGAPAIAYVTAASYSMLVQNAAHVQIFYTAQIVAAADPNAAASTNVLNIAALRALNAGTQPTISTRGYYTNGDGGDAAYYLDADDHTTADNGGTVIVTADGRRYKMAIGKVVNVKQFGAKGDWNGTAGTDDAPAFQAAINAMSGIPGGMVYVPPVAKAYRWNQNVTLTSFCTLKGSEELRIPNIQASNFNEYYGGHCIAITWGAGTTSGQALTQVYDSYIHGLTFLYPGQVTSLTASAPVAFPPTIAGVEGAQPGGSINCCYFVNSYKAIYFIYGHGELKIRSCWGAIMGDFITLSGSYNADQVEDVNASGIFYLLGSPAANFTNNTGLYSWIQKNGRAFVLGNADAIRFTNCFVGNCFVGIAFAAAPIMGGQIGVSQYSYGDWTGGGMEGVTFPVYNSGSSTSGISSNGFRFTSVGIAPVGLFNADRSVSVLMLQPTTTFSDNSEQRGHLIFTGCEFWGSGSWQTNVGPLQGHVDATGGDVDFIGCTFKVQQSYIARGFSGTPVIKFVGCTALDASQSAGSVHLTTQAGCNGKILYASSEWRGGLRVTKSGTSSIIAEDIKASADSVASASTLPLPWNGSAFLVTGTTPIDSASASWPGRTVTMVFQGAGSITGAGNIILTNGVFSAAANSTLTMVFDGSNWIESARTPSSGGGGGGGGAAPFNGTPSSIGTASPGSVTPYARGDHVHAATATNVTVTPPAGFSGVNVQASINEAASGIATLAASKAGLIGDPTKDFNAHSWNLLKVQGSGTGGGTTGANSLTVVGNNAAPNLPALSNTAIGCNALANATSCSNATALGTDSLLGVNSQGWGNVTGVGAGTQVTGSDQLQLGSSSTTSYAYGTVQNRSDARDKAAIRPTILGLGFINALKPVDFKWDYREDYVSYKDYPVSPIEPVMPDWDSFQSEEELALTMAQYEVQVNAHATQFTEYLSAVEVWRSTNSMDKIVRDGSKTRARYHHGLIAQDVQEVIASTGFDFGGFQNHAIKGGMDVMSIGYEELIAPMIKAIQELSAEVAALKSRLPPA